MKPLTVLLGYFFLGAQAFSQSASQNPPHWHLYQESLASFRRGDLAHSLTLLKRIQEEQGELPEVNFLKGQVFEQEGEYRIAEMFYRRALELSRQFYILEEKYAVFYRLANLYFRQKNYRDYERTLLELLSYHDYTRHGRFERFRDSIVRVTITKGIETTLQLFRIEHGFATKANRMLGILYCRTGRSAPAILHLALSQIALMSALVEERRSIDPTYEFEDLRELLSFGQTRPSLREFLRESGAWEGFYYLAASLFLHGVPHQARNLWEITAQFAEGELRARSVRQLRRPQREPMLGQ